MNAYRARFPRHNTFFAVIHVEDRAQALRNVSVAIGEGADGVFLINHRIPADQLRICYDAVREVFPVEWIGLNWLDLSPALGLGMMQPSMGGMWIDNADIREDTGRTAEAIRFADKRKKLEQKMSCSFLLFGGVAFKYQRRVKNLERVARLAMPFVDVITTSGEGTGIAADIEKIRIMKRAVGEHPLAIASGITPENVLQYMEYADCFLVATGVSDSHTELNPARVRKLASIVRR